jgi:hypothetical protein
MSTTADPSKGDARPDPPVRPTAEILRDLERERAGLVDAIDRLRSEAQSAKERLPSRRLAMIAGGALAGLLVVRGALRRRRERRLVDRITAALREPD